MALKRMGIVQDYEVNMCIYYFYETFILMITACSCSDEHYPPALILRKSARMLWQWWELEEWGVSLQKCSPDVALVR